MGSKWFYVVKIMIFMYQNHISKHDYSAVQNWIKFYQKTKKSMIEKIWSFSSFSNKDKCRANEKILDATLDFYL